MVRKGRHSSFRQDLPNDALPAPLKDSIDSFFEITYGVGVLISCGERRNNLGAMQANRSSSFTFGAVGLAHAGYDCIVRVRFHL